LPPLRRTPPACCRRVFFGSEIAWSQQLETKLAALAVNFFMADMQSGIVPSVVVIAAGAWVALGAIVKQY
jgi:hypothetical protein